MTIKEKQEQIISEFESLQDWEDKYGEIIRIGKELEEYPEEVKTDKYKLTGCQSQVWLNAKLEDGKIYLQADSDAMIVKGLVSLLVKVYSGHTPTEILGSPPEFLAKIGIDKHLSPTRKNGLSSMLKQIQMFAVAYKTVTDRK